MMVPHMRIKGVVLVKHFLQVRHLGQEFEDKMTTVVRVGLVGNPWRFCCNHFSGEDNISSCIIKCNQHMAALVRSFLDCIKEDASLLICVHTMPELNVFLCICQFQVYGILDIADFGTTLVMGSEWTMALSKATLMPNNRAYAEACFLSFSKTSSVLSRRSPGRWCLLEGT